MIRYSELDIVFVESYYDIPLEGLCLYKNKIERFEVVDYDLADYKIVPLTTFQRWSALLNKRMFEFCVGTHWSYKLPKDQRFVRRRADDFWFLVYYWCRKIIGK